MTGWVVTSIGMDGKEWKDSGEKPQESSPSGVPRALLKRFAEGDAQAREELFRTYERRLFALCLRMLRNREEAEDALQETFFKASRTTSFDGENFGGWIYRIAVNACRDAQTKRAREAQKVESFTLEPNDAPPNPSQVYREKVREEEMAEALESLPQDQKEVLILKYIEDLSTREVADILEVPDTTVEGRLREGRKGLRTILARRNFR